MAGPRRWFDSSQPQTLQGAVMLSYLTAAFGLLNVAAGGALEIAPIGLGVAAFGVANEMRWAYWLGVVLAGLTVFADLLIVIASLSTGVVGTLLSLVSLLFGVIVAALYLHPQSREYQRIWFK